MSVNFAVPEISRSRCSRHARKRILARQARRDRYRSYSLIEMLESRQLLSALVTTDQPDYAPRSTAIISATSDGGPDRNFQVGETVQFRVTRTDGGTDSAPANQPWNVIDGVGGFTPYQDSTGLWWYPDTDGTVDGKIGTSWYVDSQYAGASLQLTATGLSSGAVATTQFTDSGSAAITSVAVGTQTGAVTYGTTGSASFTVTTSNGSQSGIQTADLTLNGTLPAGVTASFNPATVSFNTGSNNPASTLTFTTNAATPAGSYNFSVTATGSNSVTSSSFTLLVSAKTVTPSFTVNNKVYDGTTAATITARALSGVIGADDVSLTGGTATF